MKPGPDYRKHIYWLSAIEESRLREELRYRDIKLNAAKGIVCTPLDEINRIASVAPEVWDETCSRQGSWYTASDKNGLYLIISSFELKDYEDKKAGTITKSDFEPPRSATVEVKREMIRDPDFTMQVPSRWRNVEDSEKRIYLRWAKRLGSDVEDYDFLYLSHTANHANFIRPRFFVEDDHGMVPYSIDRSAHLCSCCVELFHVLGGEYRKKLVRPCPGACIFARLKQDQYLLAERP